MVFHPKGILLAGAALTLAMAGVANAATSERNQAASTTSGYAGTRLLVNGGFERPAITKPWKAFFPDGEAIPGWIVVARSVDIVSTDWPAFRGQQCLGLNGFGPGWIRQQVATEVGQTYRLKLRLGGDPNGRIKQSDMQIRWAGQVVATLHVDVRQGLVWRRVVIDLPATQSRTNLAFRGLTTTKAGPALDRIRLEPLGQ